jgi:hypothetical protein
MVIGFFLIASAAMVWGGIVDRDNYKSVESTLTKVSECEPYCVTVTDFGGGGGGGGGDGKRNIADMQCKGVNFKCNVQWKIGDETFQASNLQGLWWDDAFSCATVRVGMPCAVVVKISDPGNALDIEPVGYNRPAALMISGFVFLALSICACACAIFCRVTCKSDKKTRSGSVNADSDDTSMMTETPSSSSRFDTI